MFDLITSLDKQPGDLERFIHYLAFREIRWSPASATYLFNDGIDRRHSTYFRRKLDTSTSESKTLHLKLENEQSQATISMFLPPIPNRHVVTASFPIMLVLWPSIIRVIWARLQTNILVERIWVGHGCRYEGLGVAAALADAGECRLSLRAIVLMLLQRLHSIYGPIWSLVMQMKWSQCRLGMSVRFVICLLEHSLMLRLARKIIWASSAGFQDGFGLAHSLQVCVLESKIPSQRRREIQAF